MFDATPLPLHHLYPATQTETVYCIILFQRRYGTLSLRRPSQFFLFCYGHFDYYFFNKVYTFSSVGQ